jgi:Uncharacterized protein conserved in bacteria
MKDNVLDVLMYLFDNFMDTQLEVDTEITISELEKAGFEAQDINRAFKWLEQLIQFNEDSPVRAPSTDSFRCFTPTEEERLTNACKDFLLMLEKSCIINAQIRELVLEQILCLEPKPLTLLQFQRLILMVLMNLPNSEDAVMWLESFVDDAQRCIQH